MRYFIILMISLLSLSLTAQADRWQQAVKYEMEIDFDVTKHQFSGLQKLKYTNNSPDNLDRVFYHLYLNAFQPNSMMDVRSKTISDPDFRVGDRISKLSPTEIGFLKVNSLTQNGVAVKYEVAETILEVKLAKPIAPGETVTFDMKFDGQVPLQIRRNGRNNAEGIDYSMAQWYPKLAEYDYQGWHANPYVGREFYGVWGDFDVKITIDNHFVVAATGVLQNKEEIGYGYTDKEVRHRNGGKLTWHFIGENVHDFFWAADPQYVHKRRTAKSGVEMHFFYIPGPQTTEGWEKLPAVMDEVFTYTNKTFGKYPYPVYSFVQGGDGGMEYPMGTLITGHRSFPSLVGVSIHELYHSWYQMILGSNEALYPWMDEGFTSFGSSRCSNYLKENKIMVGAAKSNPHINSYRGYFNLVKSGVEEPLSTHGDHFNTNFAYGQAAYSKGAVFLSTLEYIVGKTAFDKIMLQYFETWKFKHPNINDFIRVAEYETGLELDWFKEYYVNSIKSIDYAVTAVGDGRKNTTVKLERVGLFPMPIDLVITKKDGSKKQYTIPLAIMRGAKGQDKIGSFKILTDWRWTHPEYEVTLPINFKDIKSVEIDPTKRLPDVKSENNVFTPQ